MSTVVEIIEKEKLVPVVRAPSARLAKEACLGLIEGGIRVLELTLTVPGAAGVIRELKKEFHTKDGFVIGAGSIVNAQDVQVVTDAGTDFIVSPGFNPPAFDKAVENKVPFFPGVLTPSEVIAAHEAGAEILKIFPCSAMGGASYLKALKAPLPHLKLLPTGGIKQENARSFLDAGACALGVGANLVDINALEKEGRSALAQLAQSFLSSLS